MSKTRTKPKFQYAVIAAHGDGVGVANIFATEVEDEDPSKWVLSLGGEFVGVVWKNHARLELCRHQYAEAAAEAHYPVFSIFSFTWPTRGVAVWP